MMIERFTREARQVVAEAQVAARHCGHDRIDAPHLLLGILGDEDGAGCRALRGCGLRHEELACVVRDMYEPGGEQVAPLPFSAEAQTLLEIAAREAARLGHRAIGTAHLALACSRSRELPSIAPFVAGHEQSIGDAARVIAARLQQPADKPQETHMEALRRVNETRSQRVAIRRDLAAGRVAIGALLADLPACLRLVTFEELLPWLSRDGRIRLGFVLHQAGIDTATSLGEVSEHQRDELLALLRR